MFWIIIGALATVLLAIQFLPQVYKSFKTMNLEGISTSTYILILFTSTTWIMHGIHVSDFYLIIANSIVLLCALTILILKMKNKKELPNNSD